MKKRSAAADHESYVAFLREPTHVQVNAVVYAWKGSGFSMFLRGIIGPLTLERRYLVAVGGQLQVWKPPAPDREIVRIATFDRPRAGLSTGMQLDRVTIEGRHFLVEKWQRPYLRQLLELAATPSTAGMIGLPAAWYRNPWALPGQGAQLRYWDGSQWTSHVYPTADTTVAPDAK